ncbi:MAG TPA: vWA domain-containing protein [Acetobacteraceae bacterium]|nr:vWA domain-containing protein [Acetobacteraceae bacterium]
MIARRPLLTMLAITALPRAAVAEPAPSQPAVPLALPGKPAIAQRVILRPGATLYQQPDAANGKPLPGFTVYYVYGRTVRAGGGWVQIGRATDGDIAGWVSADNTIDWTHAMIGSFTNPAGRGRALFFHDEATLKSLLEGPASGKQAAALRTAALAGDPGPIVAVEPANSIDISQHFYLMPILSAERVDTYDGATVRMLETIAARAEAETHAPDTEAEALAKYRGGLVFLLDTTESMQPYIDAARSALGEFITGVGQSPVASNFRFGAIGFRDSLRDNPRLIYTAKVFAQPDFSQPPDAVLAAMAQMRASLISSAEFDEDPIAGIKAAVEDIDWTPLGGRFVMLVTDAGARSASDKLSETHMDIAQIRQLAQSRGVTVMVVHLLTPEGAKAHDHPRARAQYQDLTRQTDGSSLYFPVAGGTPAGLHAMVHDLVEALLLQVSKQIGFPLPMVGKPPPEQIVRRFAIAAEAMRLAYLGRAEGTKAPNVIHGYTSDHTYSDGSRRSIEVRVLLTRDQLSDLAEALQNILRAGESTRINPQRFFTELQAAVAAAGRDPRQIAHYDKLGDVIGQYLDGLPYRSDLMNITQDDWQAMGGIAQDEKLQEVSSKLRLYRAYADTPSLWVNLAGPDKPGEAAYPVPLDALP